MYRLKVNTSRKYTVTVADDFSAFTEEVLPLIKGEKVAIITDDRVAALYPDALDGFLTDKTVYKLVIRHGEKSKNAKNYISLINALAERGFSREDAVIALGGGVVGDLAGFVASTYMRGITLIALPTTLLSMIDSSVGGKTAIDLKYGKNLCGTFYQPSAVYINTQFLKTLPEREIKNGLGETVKYALLSDTVGIKDLEDPTAALTVYKCLKIKRDVVVKDEKENGLRALLNLGHTVGHSVEKLSGFTLPHGVAVAKGLYAAIGVSAILYGLSAEATEKMRKVAALSGVKRGVKYSAEEIAENIFADKKRRGDHIYFVGIKSVGCPSIEKIPIGKLKELLIKAEKELWI
ncbi:MAG: 3-dehydroquinate synthase [Clostridia bacterium]|nr:3-dehydroquinate synthase [Clostridia bacterium]